MLKFTAVNQTLVTFSIGFLLGVKHAFEADHILAVTTLVSEYKNVYKAALIGTFWGIGHTTTLLLIGLFVLLYKVSIPPDLSVLFESLVGLMLIVLGTRAIFNSSDVLHAHRHSHHDEQHAHIHIHLSGQQKSHQHTRSFFVGALHGVAGSGTLMILILATLRSITSGIFYILLFGIGSIVGMTLMSAAVGIPFMLVNQNFTRLTSFIKIFAGILSILFGGYLVRLGL